MLHVSAEEIAGIAKSVLEATFSMTADERPVESDAPTSVLSAFVGISGTWDGAVIVDCSPELVTRLAASMFGIEDRDVARDHIEDTMGELANMIGGNLKALLTPPSALSLPTVVEGKDYRVRVPGATVVRDLMLGVGNGRMRVLVAERGLPVSKS